MSPSSKWLANLFSRSCLSRHLPVTSFSSGTIRARGHPSRCLQRWILSSRCVSRCLFSSSQHASSSSGSTDFVIRSIETSETGPRVTRRIWYFRKFVNGVPVPHRLVAFWTNWSQVVDICCPSFAFRNIVPGLKIKDVNLTGAPWHIALVSKLFSAMKKPNLFLQCQRYFNFTSHLKIYVSYFLSVCLKCTYVTRQY